MTVLAISGYSLMAIRLLFVTTLLTISVLYWTTVAEFIPGITIKHHQNMKAEKCKTILYQMVLEPEQVRTDQGQAYSDGIYMDDGTQAVEISGNTVLNCLRSGIFLHNAHEINVHDNTCYNNLRQITIQQDLKNSLVENNSIKNNVFVARSAKQLTFYYRNYLDFPINKLGVADSNYYVKPVDDNLSLNVTLNSGCPEPEFSKMAKLLGTRLHSKSSPKTIKDTTDLRFEYNTGTSDKIISLPVKYVDVKNTVYQGIIHLAPFTSLVLIKK